MQLLDLLLEFQADRLHFFVQVREDLVTLCFDLLAILDTNRAPESTWHFCDGFGVDLFAFLQEYAFAVVDEVGGQRCTREQVAYASECSVTDEDRKSTRLNSSHVAISYAVFCLKKKTKRL